MVRKPIAKYHKGYLSQLHKLAAYCSYSPSNRVLQSFAYRSKYISGVEHIWFDAKCCTLFKCEGNNEKYEFVGHKSHSEMRMSTIYEMYKGWVGCHGNTLFKGFWFGGGGFWMKFKWRCVKIPSIYEGLQCYYRGSNKNTITSSRRGKTSASWNLHNLEADCTKPSHSRAPKWTYGPHFFLQGFRIKTSRYGTKIWYEYRCCRLKYKWSKLNPIVYQHVLNNRDFYYG